MVADSTIVGSLDMARRGDQLLARTMPRWKTDPEFREQCIQAIKVAMHRCLTSGNIRELNSTVRNAIAMEAQNQADEHLADKNARLDSGKSTENVVLRKVVIDDGDTA